MPNLSESEREFRKELASHMWAMHGQFRNTLKLTVDELEQLHALFHEDGNCSPIHTHKKSGPFELGRVKLTLGKKYIEEAVAAIRGEV